jgi:hypothetical protein
MHTQENLHVRNVTLFYRVLTEHLTELLPVIYTPTVGDACRRFGQIFRSTSGMYLSSQLHRGRVRAVLDNWPYTPDIIVATDGGRILGLGACGLTLCAPLAVREAAQGVSASCGCSFHVTVRNQPCIMVSMHAAVAHASCSSSATPTGVLRRV